MNIERSVVVPCYEEEKNIGSAVMQIIDIYNMNNIAGEIVVVNDGSADDTAKIVKKMAEGDERIRLISHEKNMGLGSACLTGFLSARGKWVTWVPGDGQLYPEDMINMCNSADGVEFAIGMVPITERLVSDNLWRFVLSKSWRLIIKGLLRFDANDFVGYAFQRKLLSSITLNSSTGLLNL